MKPIAILLFAFALMSSKSGEINSSSNLQLSVHGRDFDHDPVFNPAFYKQCVTLEVSNHGSTTQTFSIQAGAFLMPDESRYQRLMITRSENFVVKANSKQTHHLYAMCTEAHDAGPTASTKFFFSSKASVEWVKLAELIEEKNYQSSAGQNAVWALSNNYPQSDIYDEDTTVTFNLRNYVAQVKHENYLPYNSTHTYSARWFKSVKVNYKYQMNSAHKITMKLYTTDSRLFKTILEDSLTSSGNHEYNDSLLVPQNSSTHQTDLKMLRWVDNTLVDVKYFRGTNTEGRNN